MTATKPRWKSCIRWTGQDCATYAGRTWNLIPHSYWTGKGGWSETNTYHLHEAECGDDDGDYGGDGRPLTENLRTSRKLAELMILGWQPAVGERTRDGRIQWRDPAGRLHLLADLLSGAVPHAPGADGTDQ